MRLTKFPFLPVFTNEGTETAIGEGSVKSEAVAGRFSIKVMFLEFHKIHNKTLVAEALLS